MSKGSTPIIIQSGQNKARVEKCMHVRSFWNAKKYFVCTFTMGVLRGVSAQVSGHFCYMWYNKGITHMPSQK